MLITLQALPANLVKPAKDYKSKVIVESARRLAPGAAESFLNDIAPYVPVTDLYRSAAGGLRAIRNKKGSRSPGYSGHNYGYSIDIGVTEAMKNLGFKKKPQLDAWMLERGWSCWRHDGARIREEWHFDYGRAAFDRKGDRSGDVGLQRMLKSLFAKDWVLSLIQVQTLLKKLGYYHGKIDGIYGRLTREALLAFQEHWMPAFGPPWTGKAGVPTQQVLAFVAADYDILPESNIQLSICKAA